MAGRPRKPSNILRLAGAFKKDPARGRARANEPKPSAPPSAAGSWMTEPEAAALKWIVDRCAPGVLGNSDDGILELAAVLRAGLVAGTLDTKGMALLKACYGELGMTPASRSKVQATPQTEKPLNEFAAC